MSADSTIDGKVEILCNQIVKTDSEFWEIRNKAVLGLTSLINQYEGAEVSRIVEIFNPNVYRLLKDPIKAVISDLRSQQIRDICIFLIKLSEITKDHMKTLLREIFTFVLDGIKVPNRVMSGFVDNAILTMIKNSTFKSCIPSLVSEIKDSKAKLVREKCLEYLNEILIHWDITEREAEVIADAIKIGLEDAAVRGREIARMAYLNLHLLFPRKTERIKANIPPQLRQRLLKEELEKIGPILKAQEIAKASIQIKQNSPVKSEIETDFLLEKEAEKETEAEMLIIISPVKIANLRARRLSCEESAVASIQAIIRGRKCRRMTMSLHLNGDNECDGSVNSKSPLRADKDNTQHRESVCSPSLVSRAPFGAASPLKLTHTDNRSEEGKSFSRNINIENENSILGLLKVKTSMMMDHLNEQLSLIENIENERMLPRESISIDNPRNVLATSRDKFLKVVEKSLSISSDEVHVNEEFQRRMIKLLQ